MTTNPQDGNDVLFGSNAPAAKFETPGTTIAGTIAYPPKAFQEREYDPKNPGGGALKYFPSGDPIMNASVVIQTQLRDPGIEDDDGTRTLYIQGKRLKEAVRNAVKAAGAKQLEVGGQLTVTYTGDGTPPSAGANAPKEYTVQYVPAAQNALQQPEQPNPWQQGQPAPQQPVQQPQQAAVQPPAHPPQQAPAAGPTPEANKAHRNAGVDPVTVYPGYDGSLG